MKFPEARRDDLLTTQLEDEVVVYDPERKRAHSLNRTAVAVWNQCDGQTSITDLQRRVSNELGAPVSETAVWLALRKLERAHLLAAKLGAADLVSRRQMLGKAGRVGAAAVATPIVLSAFVPMAAAAQTAACVSTNLGIFVCATNCTCAHTINPVGTACVNLNPPAGAACTALGAACPAGQVCVTTNNGLTANCFPTCTPTCVCPII